MCFRLYVWIRSDLQSMTPGKAAAQVAHAASQAAFKLSTADPYIEWEESAKIAGHDKYIKEAYIGFGTTIVLDGIDEDSLSKLYWEELNTKLAEPYHGMIVDPTYPIRDGEVTHTIELLTCVWAFVDPAVDVKLINGHQLYNGNRVN